MMQKLNAYQCKSCGTRTIISHGYCPKCREKDIFQKVTVDSKGTIFSYTKIFVAEERFQGKTPYVLAVIESEEGVRLLARIKHEDMDKVSIGVAVELEGWNDNVPIFKVS